MDNKKHIMDTLVKQIDLLSKTSDELFINVKEMTALSDSMANLSNTFDQISHSPEISSDESYPKDISWDEIIPLEEMPIVDLIAALKKHPDVVKRELQGVPVLIVPIVTSDS